ncbi:MAG: Gfo/Idh/MocA family oxidoreductase, partial [Pseudomonadota bacterium]
HHANFYHKNPSVNLKYIVDIDDKKRYEAKNKFKDAIILSNYDHVIDDDAVDAISIASYDHFHYPQIMQALSAGKHLFVEKPLCQNRVELEKIYALYRKSDLIMASNFPLRTTPRFIDIKNQIKAGDFGDILTLNLSYIWGRPDKLLKGWRIQMPYYSIIQGALIHMIDLSYFFLGEWPKKIIGMGSDKGFELFKDKNISKHIDDQVCLLFKYKDGKIAYLSAQSLSCCPHFHEVKIYGSKKSFISTPKDSFYLDDLSEHRLTYDVNESEYPARSYRTLSLQKFIDAIIYKDKSLLLHQNLYELMDLVFTCEEAVN